MEHKWIYEIYINGELDYTDRFTVEEINKIKKFINKLKNKEE
jgi:hypothetical protein